VYKCSHANPFDQHEPYTVFFSDLLLTYWANR